MSVSRAPAQAVQHRERRAAGAGLRAALRWWPLLALLAVAAALRLSTLSLQSLWYDEAYTPVHVLHASLAETLRAWLHDENTPPLWYVLIWAVTRLFGVGVIALRLPSALAGIALVGVGWMIGAELGTRRTAAALAALLAVNPLFVWYSQEARAYELYALVAALSLLLFLRALRFPTPRTLAGWALCSVLALLAHYFAYFLVVPEAIVLLFALRAARPATAAVGAVGVGGAALVALVLAQGGHGTQWIGEWALSSRVVQIAGYYLLGYNGVVLGHTLLLVSALPIAGALALLALLARRGELAAGERRAIALCGGLGTFAIVLPLALALAGADYLAPRNLIADYVPLSAALAALLTARRAGRAGAWLLSAALVIGLAAVIATDFDHRLQRGDWSALARTLRAGGADRAIVTVEDGAAPLEYYLPSLGLRYLSADRAVSVREVDLVGYVPLRAGAAVAPTRAFVSVGRSDAHGLLVYRFRSRTGQLLGGRFLRDLTITVGARSGAEVLVPRSVFETSIRR